jgi:hypothetical protein
LLGTDSLASSEPWQLVPAAKSAAWNVPLLVATITVLLVALIAWLSGIAIRKHYGITLPLSAQELRAFRAARFVVVVDLLFCGGWLLIFIAGMSNFSLFAGAINPWVRLVQFIGVLAVIGAAATIWNAWLTCRSHQSTWSKLWSCLIAASALAVVWFSFAFHLTTATLHY